MKCLATLLGLLLIISQSVGQITYTVNATDDTDDGTCDAAHCSLREAFNAANADNRPSDIVFSINGGGSIETILLNDALPILTDDSTTIDGTTQTSSIGGVRIDCGGIGAQTQDIIAIHADYTKVYGLEIFNYTISEDPMVVGSGSLIGVGGIFVPASPLNIEIGAPDKGNILHSVFKSRVTSANYGNGIGVHSGTDIFIQGNRIGTNIPGDVVQEIWGEGIRIDETQFGSTYIGGTLPGEANIIGGCRRGIGLFGGDGWVRGNYVGTSTNLTNRIPNQQEGIIVNLGDFYEIGGPIPGDGNYCFYNEGNGISINTVIVNYIGHNVCAFNGATSNGLQILACPDCDVEYNECYGQQSGMYVDDMGFTRVTMFENTLHSNTSYGLQMSWLATSSDIVATENSIYCNQDEGISILIRGPMSPFSPLAATGVTLNQVTGVSTPNALIEIFLDDTTGCPNVTSCQGKIFIGNTRADGAGNWVFNAPLIPNRTYTFTQTLQAEQLTSAFTNCFRTLDCSTVVTTTNDSGPGSFREAIICANSNPGPDTITFNIPGAQVQKVIQPTTALPMVTDGATVVAANTQPFGEVFLDGTLLGPFQTGLSFQADSCELYGLRVFGFGQYGVEFGGALNHLSDIVVGALTKGNEIYECGTCLLVYGQDNIRIQDNILGNRDGYPTGTLPSNYGCDLVLNSNSTNVLVGGDRITGEGNVFVNASIAGLQVRSADEADPVRILGNYVGVDPSETIIQPNCLANSAFHGAITLTVIGGSRVGNGFARYGNVIAHNRRAGIYALFDGHRFRHNSFYCNEDGGIDLDSQGQNANQNKAAPTFTLTNVNALQGTAAPFDTVEVYLHDNTECPDAPCQGRLLLGTAIASPTGTWFINGPYSRPLQNQDEVTALATGVDGNTSTFSPCSPVCPEVDIMVSNDGPYCSGDTIRLFANLGGATGNIQYSWVGPGGYLSNEQNPTDVSRAGTYSFQANIGGCLYPAEETEVIIHPRDTIRIDSTICNNSDLMIGGEVFNINRDSADVRLINRFGCDSIIEVRLDFNSIDLAVFRDTLCEGDSRIIGGVVYDINNPSGGDTLINQAGCDSIISVELTFRLASTNEISRSLCFGDSLVVNGVVYNETNPTGSDTLVNAAGCDSIIVVDLNYSNARVENIDTTICQGDFVVINGQRYDEGNTSGSDTLVNGASNGCDSVILVNVDISQGSRLIVDTVLCDGRFLEFNGIRYDEFYPRGNDTIFGGSASGCDSIIEVGITYFQPEFTIDTLNPSCGGKSDGAIIIREISGIPGPYNFTLNGVGPIDITSFPDTITNLDEGSYFIVVNDSTDCGHIIQLRLEEAGNISINVTPEVVIRGGESTTLNFQTDFPPDSVFWISNGDTLCRDCPDLTVAPVQTTEYEVWVYRSGCSTSASITVRVENFYNIYVPNAFSPDGNNINDRFTIFSSAPGVIIENMEVYSRWGELIYQGQNMDPSDASTGWDGTFQGERLDPGVYVYRLILALPGGQKENYIGEVTLIW